MTKAISIFERIGLGGGGKIQAVYRRMNALAGVDGVSPILMTIQHGARPRLNFSDLVESGRISSGVTFTTVPDACLPTAIKEGTLPYSDWPNYDEVETGPKKTTYLHGGAPVMIDRTRKTPIGEITKRIVYEKEKAYKATLISGETTQIVRTNADGTVEVTDCAAGIPIRWSKLSGKDFVIGKNLVSNTLCRMPRVFERSIFEMIPWEDSVVFFDGVTSAYLSAAVKAPRALFLHADHRAPSGEIVPRSKFLIENFKGEAIITSTQVHKSQIEADLKPSANVHVIPHVCEVNRAENTKRKHLVTVSRLELTGKPIHECIEAFCQIKDEFPEINYLIYGEGSGRRFLENLITKLDCDDRVKLMGYTDEPLSVFSSATTSLYPTTTEGFGLSILEALSCGCPVISYDVNYGPRELIKPGVNGDLVPSSDIDAIARSIRRVLKDAKKFQNGATIGLERYSKSAHARNYSIVIDALSGMQV